jgi:hypothetical protein
MSRCWLTITKTLVVEIGAPATPAGERANQQTSHAEMPSVTGYEKAWYYTNTI